MKVKRFFFLSTFFIFLFFPSRCFAQGFSLSINPPILEAMIQPGKQIIYTFDLQNHSNTTPVNLNAKIIPFEALGNQGRIHLLDNEEPPDFFSLLNADISLNQPFYLEPNQRIQLVLLVSVPQNQPEGDYYQTLIVEQSLSQGSLLGNLSQSLGAVGANILLTVSQSGQPQKSLEISSFFIPKTYFNKIVDSFDVVNFELNLKNTGQAFVKPEGSIFIRPKGENEDIQEIKIRPDNILPGTSRQMRCLEKPCFFKTSRLINAYQARFEFVLEGKKYQSTVSFWVFPIKITLGLIFLLLLCLVFLWQIRKRS